MVVTVRYDLRLIEEKIMSSAAFSAKVDEVATYMVAKAKEYAINGVYGQGSYDTGQLANSIHFVYRQGNQFGRWFTLAASAVDSRGVDYARFQHNGVAAVQGKFMAMQPRRNGLQSVTYAYNRRAVQGNPFFYAAARDAAAHYGGILRVGTELV